MDKTPEYKFLPEGSYDPTSTCPIQIMEGQFKDIVYRYNKISLEEISTGDLKVNMDIEMIKAPEGFNQQQEDFTKVIGNIFVDIVESGVEADDYKDLEADVHEDRVDNP